MVKSSYVSKSKRYFITVIITSIIFSFVLLHIATLKDSLNKELEKYDKLSYDVNGTRFLTHGVNNLAINIKEYVVTGNSEYLRKYNKEIYIDKNRERVINSICENEVLSSACPSLGKAMSYSNELLRYELQAVEYMKDDQQQAAIDLIYSESYMNFVDKIYENVDKFKSESLNIIDYESNKVKEEISSCWYSSTFVIIIYVFFILVITDRVYKHQKKSIKKMLRDHITGLGNSQALLRNHNDTYKLNCLVIDLIDFHFINRIHGLKHGDNTLIQITKRVSKYFKKSSIYKVSGRRFIVLTKKKITDELLKDLISLINEPIKSTLKYGKIEVNSTMGVALHDLNIDSIDRLIDIAGFASISTKNKNSYTYASKETIKEFIERGSLIDKLDASIVNDAIYPFYQPIIDPHKNCIVGMDAKARWNKDGEILALCDFYEFSKDVGLVFDIDITVLQQAIRDLYLLKEKNLVSKDFFVSIRLSCFSIKRLNLNEILNLLQCLGLNPYNIQIEVSKEVFESKELINLIQNLSEIGFKILIENIDFNLTKLKYLTNIKIRIQDIKRYTESKNKIFLDLLLHLTKKLDLGVSIKDIKETSELKTALNFDKVHVQGLYFSEPVEINQLVTML